jgi:hypothetical protein
VLSGGYFIGCVPDGKRVKAHLGKGARLLEQPHLRLKAISDVGVATHADTGELSINPDALSVTGE